MATFTIELKNLLALNGATVERENGRTTVRNSGIGLEHYPIFDEDYRDTLNGLIVDRYWNREIGQETGAMFALAFQHHMALNMPFFNKLYETELLDIDPLSTVNIRTAAAATGRQEASTTGETSSSSETSTASRSVASDLPQTMLAGNEDYASSASDGTSTSGAETAGSEQGQSETFNEQDSESVTTGYQGHTVELLANYRASLLNIDMMVLESLEPLFMGIFNNGDAYTGDYRYGY